MKVLKAFLPVALIFLCGCVSMIRPCREKVTISSDPPGAEIIVDSTIMGVTPCTLKLKRVNTFVTVRKEGYKPMSFYIVARKNGGRYFLSGILGAAAGSVVGSIVGVYHLRPDVEVRDTVESIPELIALVYSLAVLECYGGALIGGLMGMFVGPIISIFIDNCTGVLNDIPQKNYFVKLERRNTEERRE